MYVFRKILSSLLALCLFCGLVSAASASVFTDAHGNIIVSPEEALAMLGEEAAGSAPAGICYYNAQGGF